MDDIMKKYNEITYKIPPIVTAAAVPVVGLSLLCKAVTGHGLPGTLPREAFTRRAHPRARFLRP